MKATIDEVVELYFEGHRVNEIMAAMKENKEVKQKKTTKSHIKKQKKPIIKEQYIDFSIPKQDYPEALKKLDIKEREAIEFNRALKAKGKLTIGKVYEVLIPKHGNGKKDLSFKGVLKEENSRLIRLEHERGYSGNYLKSDLITGYYLIKEA